MDRFSVIYGCLVIAAILGAISAGEDNEGQQKSQQSIPFVRLMSELRQDQHQARDKQSDSDRLSAIKQQAAPARHEHWSALDSYYDTIGLRSRQYVEFVPRSGAMAPKSSMDDAALISMLSTNRDRDEPKEFDRVNLLNLNRSVPQQSFVRSPFAGTVTSQGDQSDRRPNYRLFSAQDDDGGTRPAAQRKSDAIDSRFVPQRRGQMPPDLSLILKHGHRQPELPSEYPPISDKQRDDIKNLLLGAPMGRRETPAHRLQTDLANQCQSSPDYDYLASRDTFPSHLGLYRAKELASGYLDGEIEYLCGATLLGERHALTLASCLRSHSPDQLFVQTNQWTAHELSEGDRISRQPLRRVRHRVKEMHIFPRFNSAATDPQEHNLAIVRLKQPITDGGNKALPACLLMPSQRPNLLASTCVTPARNISMEEYFDPHGEGETKLKPVVQMVSASVKLIANNEPLCFNQTKQQYFNFVNPDYICSADFKTARWRSRLGRPENYGSGIYCDEGDGRHMLVSVVQPVVSNSLTAYGYLDLSYYSSWIVNVISGASFRS